MPKFNNFNPKKAELVFTQGNYSLYLRSDIKKYLLVKDGKVLNYIEEYSVEDDVLAGKTFVEIADSWIKNFEFNAKRDFEILTAKVEKYNAQLDEIANLLY